MCRMFGVYTTNEISPLHIKEFSELAAKGAIKPNMTHGHLDGWGLGGYLGDWAVHFGRSKKALVLDLQSFSDAVIKAVHSNTKFLISHIRKASKGVLKKENSHPFIFNDWIFAHNGTIYNSEKLNDVKHKYEGETDSERFFIFLAERLRQKPLDGYMDAIKNAIDEIKSICTYSSLTFLMTNGRCLIGYRDFTESENYYTLYYSFNKSHGDNNISTFLCSEKLCGSTYGVGWLPLMNGELFYIDKFAKQKKIVNLTSICGY